MSTVGAFSWFGAVYGVGALGLLVLWVAATVLEVEGLGRSKWAWSIVGVALTWLTLLLALLFHFATELTR